MKRPGCCGNCDGEGADASAPETGGLCWDCQGTGHAHSGRCRSRFLDWWHLKESTVVLLALAWTLITTAVLPPVLPVSAYAWAAPVSTGPAVLAIFAMIVLGRAADRQILRYGLPPAWFGHYCAWCRVELARWRVLLLRRYCSVCAPRMLGDAGIYGQAGGPPCSKGARAGQTERSH